MNVTLTQTAILAKQVIALAIITIIVGIVGFVSYKIWYAYYLSTIPIAEEKPDTKFGLLPPPDFPRSSVSSSNFTYTLDTSTGNLPKVGVDSGFEKIIRVYFVTPSFATFLAPERSQTLAQKLGILTAPQILSETEYQFVEGNKKLTVNLDTGNFKFIREASTSGKIALDEDDKLVSDFKKILKTLDAFKLELDKGRTKITLLKTDSGNLIPTTLRSETEAVRISLWPEELDSKPIFTPNFNQSLINAVVVKSANNIENYFALDFSFYPVDINTYATYPSKTAEEAFEDLKSGKGTVILEPNSPQVSITSVYLGYYLAENYNPYLQPIFVFEGPQFVSYVSAINSSFVNLAN